MRDRQNLIESRAHAEARLADSLARGTVPPALLAEVADLKARIESLEQGISAGFSGFDALASPRPLDMAQALYRLLIRPVEEPMADVRHLFVVTNGPLTALPFQLLVDAPEDLAPSNDADVLRQTNWLIRKVALTTLPSVESLAALRGANLAPGAPGTGQLLPWARQGGVANVDAVRALPPLPGTVREIASAFATGHADLRMGAAATETALKSADRSGALAADVVVFATHGLVSGELGLSEPALVLTPPATSSSEDDGLLTASEISALDLHANWVVLSACNTASGDGQPDADGLSGLARAFFLAGARAMLVSHWPVRDDAAARLTTGAFREMANAPTPIRKADAMRRSMIALMENTRDPTLAHPFAWASFVVVGEGGY